MGLFDKLNVRDERVIAQSKALEQKREEYKNYTAAQLTTLLAAETQKTNATILRILIKEKTAQEAGK